MAGVANVLAIESGPRRAFKAVRLRLLATLSRGRASRVDAMCVGVCTRVRVEKREDARCRAVEAVEMSGILRWAVYFVFLKPGRVGTIRFNSTPA